MRNLMSFVDFKSMFKLTACAFEFFIQFLLTLVMLRIKTHFIKPLSAQFSSKACTKCSNILEFPLLVAFDMH